MSETQTENTLAPLTVLRNDVELSATQTEVKKGDNKGLKYLAFDVNKENLPQVEAWVGVDTIVARIKAFLRQQCLNWWSDALEDNTNDEGQINLEKARADFTRWASEFSARGESIAELTEKQAELISAMTELDKKSPTYVADFTGMLDELTKIQNAISDKRRGPRKSKDAAVAA